MCSRRIEGREVEFGTTGYTMENVFVLYDRATSSLWYPLDEATFAAVAGDNKGKRLAILEEPPSLALGEWVDAWPDTLVLLPPLRDVAYFEGTTSVDLALGRVVEDGAGLRVEVPRSDSLRPGDRLVRIDGWAARDLGGLRKLFDSRHAGDRLSLEVERDGNLHEVELVLLRD